MTSSLQSDVTLQCSITLSSNVNTLDGLSVNVQWKFNNDIVPNTSPATDLGSNMYQAEYSLTPVTINDAGLYTCGVYINHISPFITNPTNEFVDAYLYLIGEYNDQ